MVILIVLLVVVALIVLWVIATYNGLVSMRANRENAFADIDVQLKQRSDLIPQLVEVVKGYSFHEKDLLEKITRARTGLASATTVNDKVKADGELTSALQGLRIACRSLPRFKSQPEFFAVTGRDFGYRK